MCSSQIYIADCSVITPAGNTLQMVQTSIDCGISALAETPFFNLNNHPMKGAQIPPDALLQTPDGLNGCNGRTRRMLQIALSAIEPLRPALSSFPQIPFLLAGPEMLPLGNKHAINIGAEFFRLLYEESELNLDTQYCRYIPSGRSGGLELLSVADEYFQKNICNTVLLGAVDSFVDPATLYYLCSNDRIMAGNKNIGFFPSEAGIFMLVTKDRDKASLKAHISRPTIATEESHLYSSKPCLGDAMTTICRNLFVKEAPGPISTLWSTVNGEHFNMKEFGLALIRHIKSFDPNFAHIHPADCYGDCGAASGLLLAALACQKAETAKRKETALILASSDLKSRAGLIVHP